MLLTIASKYVLSSLPHEIGGIFHLMLFGCLKKSQEKLTIVHISCLFPHIFFYTVIVHHSCHSDHVLWDLRHHMIW